jgi:hypothetical protein
MDLIESSFLCAACGQRNDLFVDPSGGAVQSYVEDCRVCCRPNALVIRLDLDAVECSVEAALEGE